MYSFYGLEIARRCVFCFCCRFFRRVKQNETFLISPSNFLNLKTVSENNSVPTVQRRLPYHLLTSSNTKDINSRINSPSITSIYINLPTLSLLQSSLDAVIQFENLNEKTFEKKTAKLKQNVRYSYNGHGRRYNEVHRLPHYKPLWNR